MTFYRTDKRHGQSPDAKKIDDLCLCGRGRLKEGYTESKIRAEDILKVIKNVPARICSLCDEAYISPETSEQIEEIIANITLEGWQQSPTQPRRSICSRRPR